MIWRSKDILKRPESSMHRALFKSMGYSDHDLPRPLLGVANSWNRVVPGHYSLNLVSDHVKQGIIQAEGTPVEFDVIAACDGIANGHAGMRFILPSRSSDSFSYSTRGTSMWMPSDSIGAIQQRV